MLRASAGVVLAWLAQVFKTVRERTATGGAAVACRASALGHDLAHDGSAAAPAPDTRIEALERLAQLRAAGVLEDEESRAEKTRILGGSGNRAAA